MSLHYLSSRQPIIDKMVFFCAVLDAGSFREAASKQGISPAAGSRWVKELEEVLNIELIKRSTRQLTPTQAGQLLYQRLSQILPEINATIEEVQNLAELQQGEIRISSTPLFARQYLSKIISEYMLLHPKVDFKVFIEAGDFDPLTIDFAFRAEATYIGETPQDSLLVRRKLLSEPLYLCASPRYLEKMPPPQHPEELMQHRCLYARTLLGGNRWGFSLNNIATVVEIKDALECDNSEMLCDLALQGAGIAYLPHSVIHHHLQQKQLINVMSDYQCANFDIYMYFRPRHPMPERCAQFKQYLIDALNK